MGLLGAADYFGWIHQFRTKVYYESRRYNVSVKRYTPEHYRHIRIVRDPFSRVVSAYLHGLEQGYAHQRIAHFLGEDRAYSFREFVAWLSTLNLAHDNIHFSFQSTVAERNGTLELDELIRIEDGLEKRLAEVEQRLGLESTDFADGQLRSKHRNDYAGVATFAGDVAHEPGAKPAAPSYEWFYDQSLVAQVATLYACDFAMYGYSTELAAPGASGVIDLTDRAVDKRRHSAA